MNVFVKTHKILLVVIVFISMSACSESEDELQDVSAQSIESDIIEKMGRTGVLVTTDDGIRKAIQTGKKKSINLTAPAGFGVTNVNFKNRNNQTVFVNFTTPPPVSEKKKIELAPNQKATEQILGAGKLTIRVTSN